MMTIGVLLLAVIIVFANGTTQFVQRLAFQQGLQSNVEYEQGLPINLG